MRQRSRRSLKPLISRSIGTTLRSQKRGPCILITTSSTRCLVQGLSLVLDSPPPSPRIVTVSPTLPSFSASPESRRSKSRRASSQRFAHGTASPNSFIKLSPSSRRVPCRTAHGLAPVTDSIESGEPATMPLFAPSPSLGYASSSGCGKTTPSMTMPCTSRISAAEVHPSPHFSPPDD